MHAATPVNRSFFSMAFSPCGCTVGWTENGVVDAGDAEPYGAVERKLSRAKPWKAKG
jgi:hypothetical protein